MRKIQQIQCKQPIDATLEKKIEAKKTLEKNATFETKRKLRIQSEWMHEIKV